MDCYKCKIPLIWGGDQDIDDPDDQDHTIVSNLSCNTCGAVVFVYHS